MADPMKFRMPKVDVAKFEQQVNLMLQREAIEFQEQVAGYIGGHKKRPGDSTGRLQEVTSMPGNRVVFKTVWRVGIPKFLNESQAKYWRLIEQGSAGLYAHGKGFRGTPLRLRPGGFPGGRPFRSIGPANAHLPNDVWRGTGTNRTRIQSLVFVSHEIQPMNAYRTVFAEFNWRERVRREFQQVVGRNFGA